MRWINCGTLGAYSIDNRAHSLNCKLRTVLNVAAVGFCPLVGRVLDKLVDEKAVAVVNFHTTKSASFTARRAAVAKNFIRALISSVVNSTGIG